MLYDSDKRKILISSREFVNVARRGISATMPYDSDEPVLSDSSRYMKKKAIGEAPQENIVYSFSESGYDFEITAIIDKADGEKLWFAREVEGNPNRPRKEFSAEMRGEAFVAALAYAKTKGIDRVNLNYVYINSEVREYAESCEWVSLKKLESFFEKCARSVGIYARPEINRVTERLPSMKALKFPYEYVRGGQSELVRRAYKNIARGGTLYATAPTGTGKTVSVLFPAVRAMGEGHIEKTFYFTPKETTARAAIECIDLMAEQGAKIRGIKISAKAKCCINGLLCREGRDRCQYSKFNKLADAALDLFNTGKTVVTDKEIDEIAKKWQICPYELSLTYAELCDAVICDFNYLFDPDVYIRRFFTAGGKYAFLIDEAHNLPDRAREMYSAEVSASIISEPAVSEVLGEFSNTRKAARVASSLLYDELYPLFKDEMYEDGDGNKKAAVHLKEIPAKIYEIFDTLVSTVENEILANYIATDDEKNIRIAFLQDYLTKIKKFRAVAYKFDSSYEMFVFYNDGDVSVKLFCIDTGKEIRERLSKGHSAVFFSATLTPLYYYKSLLGGDGTSDTLEVESPFEREQLSVTILDKISTRYSERTDTLSAVCRAIAATVSARRGNYMIFSPSFAYSDALAKAFSKKYPKIKVMSQKKDMTKKEKEEFLKEFSKDDKSYLIGFCVMGGIYSEGIDLAGDSLIGAVIVGIGMPSLSYEREAICAYFDEKYEEGKLFAYVYPGMNRVLQAAGRVIRREDDRGVIVLIDDRFDDPIYRKIIPSLWGGMKFIGDAKVLREELDKFWEENNK